MNRTIYVQDEKLWDAVCAEARRCGLSTSAAISLALRLWLEAQQDHDLC